jgi:hypothetical protein
MITFLVREVRTIVTPHLIEPVSGNRIKRLLQCFTFGFQLKQYGVISMFKQDFEDLERYPSHFGIPQAGDDECMRAVLNELESDEVCGTTELVVLLGIAASRYSTWMASLSALLNTTLERIVKDRTAARDGESVHITYPVSRRPVI